jgi:hypothetical protein
MTASSRRWVAAASLAAALFCVIGAATGAAASRWHPVKRVNEAVDLAGPRGDGRLIVATTGVSLGRLWLYRPGDGLTRFARGSSGYSTSSGEPYIDVSSGRRLDYANCSFGRDAVYALDQSMTPGVVKVTRAGIASRFVNLPLAGIPRGITFDRSGRFGYRLLVATAVGASTTVYGFDCRGHRAVFAEEVPAVEGGIRVAPRSFGPYGGQLIAPDEYSGNVYAISKTGAVHVVVNAGIAAGGEIGVEALGFVPQAFDRRPFAAFVSSSHGGSDFGRGSRTILSIGSSGLREAGLRPGDLLAANELAGTTVAIRCRKHCAARAIATGPRASHFEGHIVFAPASK